MVHTRDPFWFSKILMKPELDECALGTHNCHTNADCIDEDIGFKCECWHPFIDQNGDGRNCVDFDECTDSGFKKLFLSFSAVSKKVNLRVKSVIINPLFDGNHICASARNDVVINCTNLVPTGNDYCVVIDETILSAEEIKWIRAQAAVGDTGCPGYSCECESGY